MAKIFSFIGIPSPKNYVKFRIPSLTDRSDHVFTNLSIVAALIPFLNT